MYEYKSKNLNVILTKYFQQYIKNYTIPKRSLSNNARMVQYSDIYKI